MTTNDAPAVVPEAMEETKTPAEWDALAIDGIRIVDADGWRFDDGSPPWDHPITRAEFLERRLRCTVTGIARTDDAPAVVPEAVDIAIDSALMSAAQSGREQGDGRDPRATQAAMLNAETDATALRAAIADAIADARREAEERGRADMAAELDAAIAQAHAAHAAGYVDDEGYDDDWTPPVCLAFQPWAGGTWRVALDDGRADPPDMARDTPTEALVMLAHRLAAAAALDEEADDGR